MQTYPLLAINIALLTAGQVLWKLGVSNIKNVTLCTIINSLYSPLILGGLLLYGVATVIWLIILSKEQFSIVYPLQSISYIFGIFVACLIFKEHIPISRWLGAAIIFVGVLLITKN